MKIRQSRCIVGVFAVALMAGTTGTALAAQGHQDGGRDKITERESAQPVDDTWITTKVKADLLATEDVSGLALNVETVNGVVSLSGEVDSRAEADRAVKVASGIEGVKRVDGSGIKVRKAGTP
ncbi:MAG: BON domain-containing protein [Luteimonas sp.]|nr:BON domain-containing protein [Luteimonas sp.]